MRWAVGAAGCWPLLVLSPAQSRDGFDQALARPERNAQLLQVRLAQPGQILQFDLLLGKQPSELPQPNAIQPRGDAALRHAVSPRRDFEPTGLRRIP